MTGSPGPRPSPVEDRERPDGPWRVAETCMLCLVEAESRSPAASEDLAGHLRLAGFPIAEVRTIKPFQAEGSSNRTADPDVGPLLCEAALLKLDLLIIGPSIDLQAEAALELRRAAKSDPMIAGVSPRFSERTSSPAADRPWWRILPAVTYLPLADLRCLYVKTSVVAQMPPDTGRAFDWDAYAMRINAGGFRMVRANHAPAVDPRPDAEGALDLTTRARRLEPCWPGTRRAVASFLSSAPRAASRVLAALATDDSGRRRVCFDLTHVGAKRSGTGEAALALIRGAARAWAAEWQVCVLASPATYAFHFEGTPSDPDRIDPTKPGTCSVFVRIGQPFSWKEVETAVGRAPALAFFMLDTIGLDCIRLAPDDLDALWRFTLAEADGLVFNSAFTARQYGRRFGLRGDQIRLTSLHSLDTRDYTLAQASAAPEDLLLVIGNDLPHKQVETTARLLAAAFPGRPIAALGLASGAVAGVDGLPSGELDDAALAALYRRAALVIYPSLYEGFGLPLMEALAHRKPILVHALPPFAEIAAGVPEAANIHVFRSDDDLLAAVRAAPAWVETPGTTPVRRWEDAVGDLRHVVEGAVSAVDYDRVVRRIDFLRGRLTFIRQKPFEQESAALGEELDRLSAWAGRLARTAVLGAANLPGGRALIRGALAAARRGRAR